MQRSWPVLSFYLLGVLREALTLTEEAARTCRAFIGESILLDRPLALARSLALGKCTYSCNAMQCVTPTLSLAVWLSPLRSRTTAA